MLKRYSVILYAFLFLSGCGSSAGTRFMDVSDDFFSWYFETYPVSATWIGVHDYDHKIGEASLEAVRGNREKLERFRSRLAGVDPADLPVQMSIDYHILSDAVDEMLFDMNRLKEYEWNPMRYVRKIGSSVMLLISQDFAPQKERLTSLRSRLREIPGFLEGARKLLTTAPQVYTETAISQNRGNLQLLREGMYDYIEDASPEETAALERAAAPAIEAVERFGEWLEEDLLPRSDMDFRLGAELFAEKFKLKLDTDMSHEEVLSRAESDLTIVQDAMYRAALPLYRNMMHKPNTVGETHSRKQEIVEAVLFDIARDHSPRNEVVENARRYIENLNSFVEEKNIITLDRSEPLEIREMPEFMRGVAIAYLESPGPLEKKLKTFYDVSPIPEDWTEEQSESFLREYNNRSVQILSIHEAVPGHYVQLYYSNRYPSIIRSVFGSGTFIEGWAHYCEQMMVDEGYGNGDPRMRLVQLKWRLRVLTNVIIDNKIHTAGMTRDEAMKLMMKEGFQEESEASGKWVRAQLSSTQLSTYYVGTIEILDLRHDYMNRMGDAYSLKQFHENLLAYGSPPVKYARMLLMGTEG